MCLLCGGAQMVRNPLYLPLLPTVKGSWCNVVAKELQIAASPTDGLGLIYLDTGICKCTIEKKNGIDLVWPNPGNHLSGVPERLPQLRLASKPDPGAVQSKPLLTQPRPLTSSAGTESRDPCGWPTALPQRPEGSRPPPNLEKTPGLLQSPSLALDREARDGRRGQHLRDDTTAVLRESRMPTRQASSIIGSLA